AISSPRQAQSLGIRTIYQEFNLIPHLSAAENIFLGSEPLRGLGVIDQSRIFSEASRLLQEVGAAFSPRSRLGSLSLAEQQMVEVAKAISQQARILIMDEPTSALSDSEIAQLFTTVRRLQKKGTSVIYISHRLEELFEIGDRVTVLRDGRRIDTRPVRQTAVPDLVRLMTDREISNHFPKQKCELGEEVLRVEGLRLGRQLRGVDLSLRQGEVLGVAGLVGSGRTALARALFGAEPSSSGRIWMRGRRLRLRSPAQAIRQGIALLPEDRKSQGLVLGLSLQDNIALPNLDALSRLGVVKGRKVSALARRFIRDLRIKTPGPAQKVMFLSGGNQQKVALSKWLARDAEVLIFDEPTRGIDVGAKVEIYQLINRLTARGAAILMISSELPEILAMSDRILVLHEGRVSGEFAAEEATQEKLLSAAIGEGDGGCRRL
ncbi:MAG: sugar ABC transporter ATP-binding protein, partial [Acidobacteriota bacterium]